MGLCLSQPPAAPAAAIEAGAAPPVVKATKQEAAIARHRKLLLLDRQLERLRQLNSEHRDVLQEITNFRKKQVKYGKNKFASNVLCAESKKDRLEAEMNLCKIKMSAI